MTNNETMRTCNISPTKDENQPNTQNQKPRHVLADKR